MKLCKFTVAVFVVLALAVGSASAAEKPNILGYFGTTPKKVYFED